MDNHLFAYFLTVTGTDEDQKKVYDLLEESHVFEDDYLAQSFHDVEHPYKHYQCPEDIGSVSEWTEDEMENTLHNIAVKVPNAVLEIYGEDTEDSAYSFTKRFHGDLYQESKAYTSQPPLLPGADVPFDTRSRDYCASALQRLFPSFIEKTQAMLSDFQTAFQDKVFLYNNVGNSFFGFFLEGASLAAGLQMKFNLEKCRVDIMDDRGTLLGAITENAVLPAALLPKKTLEEQIQSAQAAHTEQGRGEVRTNFKESGAIAK